jgi:hypothetical protein
MTIDFHKTSCFNRAKALLAEEDDSLLRYICLELRFCLEAITYDKLRTYIKRIPEEVLETWQPPQAMRALLEFEPDADQDFSIRISPETKSGVPTGEWTHLGVHHIFKLSWLRKTYNKLGNFLHVPTPRVQRGASQQQSPAQLRKAIEEIIAELEPIVASSLDSSLAMVVEFQCSVCNNKVFRNLDSEQIPQSSRWNVLPVERINRSLVMRHEHPACALV